MLEIHLRCTEKHGYVLQRYESLKTAYEEWEKDYKKEDDWGGGWGTGASNPYSHYTEMAKDVEGQTRSVERSWEGVTFLVKHFFSLVPDQGEKP